MDAFVLAGGRSQRMGVDKARAPVRGVPMALAVAAVLRERCERVVLVRRGGTDGLPWPGQQEVVYEPERDRRHPLWGVATALREGHTRRVVIVSCDLPCFDVAALDVLLEGAGEGAAIATDGAREHPLVGVFPRSQALRERAERLAAQGASVRSFVKGLGLRVPLPAEALINANRPEDLSESPLARLAEEVGFLPDDARRRLLRGEVRRMAQLGMVDPWAGQAVWFESDEESP